jgi:hypothetical protein
MKKAQSLRLSLLQNAYEYLNESLVQLSRAREQGDQLSWKSALLNITFCIELMLKERLRREHHLLIYANIDRFRPITRETTTVSWKVLIERLHYVLGSEFSELDAGRLSLAQLYRNQMLHYDVFLEFPDAYHDFANLLNFVSKFYSTFLRRNEEDYLRNHIRQNLWFEEDELVFAFEEEIVFYNDIFMSISLKDELEKEQGRADITLDGEIFKRIPYGSSKEYSGLDLGDYSSRPCGDCKAGKGQFHLLGCDIERCPKCGRQLLSCRCKTADFEKPDMTEEFHQSNDQFFDSP